MIAVSSPLCSAGVVWLANEKNVIVNSRLRNFVRLLSLIKCMYHLGSIQFTIEKATLLTQVLPMGNPTSILVNTFRCVLMYAYQFRKRLIMINTSEIP